MWSSWGVQVCGRKTLGGGGRGRGGEGRVYPLAKYAPSILLLVGSFNLWVKADTSSGRGRGRRGRRGGGGEGRGGEGGGAQERRGRASNPYNKDLLGSSH